MSTSMWSGYQVASDSPTKLPVMFGSFVVQFESLSGKELTASCFLIPV